MGNLPLERITHALGVIFAGKIDLSDSKLVGDDRDSLFRTRALAAYALMMLADADPTAAAASVTDGMNDGGLDAIYFDRDDKCLYLVQSKWSGNATKTIGQGEARNFIGGIRALISADLSSFNQKIQGRGVELNSILLMSDVRIVLVVAHSSVNSLGTHVEYVLNEFLAEQNILSDTIDHQLVTLEVLDLPRIYKAVSGAHVANGVSLQIALDEWGTVAKPHRAYYGQVEVANIAKWAEYGRAIFSRNLRFYRGRSDVNEAVEKTLVSSPADFWYFNNGITILCTRIAKLPLNGDNRNYAIFECDGVSVVNGAQTVGVICEAAKKSPPPSGTKVHVRLISLESCPEDFAADVARATNTQNRIERRDFAALDPNQQRLAMEMALDGKRYVFKSSAEDDPKGTEGCSIEEATVALACAIGDVTLSVQAKREVGKLWESIGREPYTRIFRDDLEARYMWRAVVVSRTVSDTIASLDRSSVHRGELVAVHGNRFILHRVFQDPAVRSFGDLKRTEEDVCAAAAAATSKVFSALANDIHEHFSGAYLANLFKNSEKCKDIDARLSGRSTKLVLVPDEVKAPRRADPPARPVDFPPDLFAP